jgi:hypothetical protein
MVNARGKLTVQERMREVLRSGPITGAVNNAEHGITPSQIVTITRPDGKGTVKAIVKAGGVANEVGASTIAEAIGLDFVPPTTVRTVNGVQSSVQLVVSGLTRWQTWSVAPPGKYNPEANEQFRMFDYIIANGDRHGWNVLLRSKGGEFYPVAIDHNLALQGEGGNIDTRAEDAMKGGLPDGPISKSTKGLIATIDSAKVAQAAAGSGLDRNVAKGVLLRIERLKKDPGIIQLGRYGEAKQIAANPEANASADVLKRVDGLLNAAYKAN